MRLTVHVRPGASRTSVGGSHDGALVVRVAARAVEGAATAAVLVAVAQALGVRRREVALVSGATNRNKVLEVPDGMEEAVAALLAGQLSRARGPLRETAAPTEGPS